MSGEEIEDCLMVKVLEARNLMVTESGTPQAYAEVRVGSVSELTETSEASLNPVWESTTMVFTGIVNAGVDSMRIALRGKDPFNPDGIKLGMVPIDLADVLLSPYAEIDEWYPVVREVGMSQVPSGEVRLQFTYFLEKDTNIAQIEEEALKSPSSRSKAPNLATVFIGKAKGLKVDNIDTLDPIAVVECNEYRKETKCIKKNNNPKWDSTFTFPVTDEGQFVEVSIYTVGYLARTLVGRCRISLVEVAGAGSEGLKRWCPLMSEDYEVFTQPHGEVEVNIGWAYDENALSKARSFWPSPSKKKKKVTKLDTEITELMKQTEAEEVQVKKGLRTRAQAEEYELARKSRADLAQQELDAMNMLGGDDMKEGDYQVQVHIIEAKDLAAADFGGTSDPCVYVYLLGQKKKTRIHYKTTSCVFDETLYFNFKNLTREEIDKAVIKLTCFDADTFSRWDQLGSNQYDMKSIYRMKDHEFYRQWVALYNTKLKDATVQGYLRVSITVLGPGDHQAQHNLDEEMQEELADSEQAGGPGGAIMAGPSVNQELFFLVLTIYWAEDLPMMDSMTVMGGSGIDALVHLEMGGNKNAKSSVVNVKGKGRLSPVFNEELWMPVMDPPASNRVAISIWDKNITTSNTLLGYTYFDYRKIVKKTTPEGGFFSSDPVPFSKPFWVNFYGAPHEIRTSKGAKFVGTYPDYGSSYRGRLLCSMHVVTQPKSNELLRPHTKRINYELPPSLFPETASYTLRLHLVYGSEIPVFQGVTGVAKMGVRVLIGNSSLIFNCRANKKGMVTWDELREQRGIILPADITQIPDIIIQLFKYPDAVGPCVSFVRFSAVELLAKQFQDNVPTWYTLQADKAREGSSAGIPEEDHPGALLIKAGFGLDEDAMEEQWADEADILKNKAPYSIRAHIYQCRNLPSADDNGLLDPYVKIRYGGVKQKTRIKDTTTSPLYYETLEFEEMLPTDLRFAPEVVLQVWDSDTLSTNSQVGMLRIPCDQATISKSDRSMLPSPTWMKLLDSNGEEGDHGEILVSLQLIKKVDVNQDLQPAPDITPRMKICFVEVFLLGLRDLKKYGFGAINEPYIKFQISTNGSDGAVQWTTSPSKEPTGKDPNFLLHKVLPVELPENPAFAPNLEVRVFDRLYGGMSAPLIGATAISLKDKMPWNPDEYMEPNTMISKKSKEMLAEIQDDEEAENSDDEEENPEAEGAESKDKGGGKDEKDKTESSSVPMGEQEDTGAGVFPVDEDVTLPKFKEDLEQEEEHKRKLEELKAKKKASLAEAAAALGAQGVNLSELPIDFPTTWASSDFIEGRDWFSKDKKYSIKELEHFLETSPFEVYKLSKGATKGGSSLLSKGHRVTGYLKGVIRICTTDPRFEPQPFIDMRGLSKVQQCLVRCYVVKGEHLQPKDANGLADPYLVCKLGKEKISTRSEHLDKTLEPEFYQSFEFQTTLPGPSQLKLQCFDYDRFTLADDLIGETIIDLEDRWFHPKWLDLGQDASRAHLVGPVKPLEQRNLWVVRSNNPQGQLQMWVDIMTMKEARRVQKEKLFGPPEQKVEVRVVCWKSEGVRSKAGGITDLFVQFWMEGQTKRQDTDTHWRCKNGKGSWNYRLKFPVSLPIKSEFSRLRFQVWNRGIIVNDLIAEGTVDLHRWFLLQYHRKASVKPFQEIKDAMERKSLTTPKVEEEDINETEGDLTEVVVDKGDDNNGDEDDQVDDANKLPTFEYDDVLPEGGDDEEEEEDEESDTKPLLDDAEEEDEEEEEGGKASEDETKDFLEQMKTYLGIGKIAPDAEWIDLIYKDVEAGTQENRGKLAISIDIVPEEEAQLRKVGFGRDEPNTNPFLPPPVGRMQFSLNPFVMIQQMLGPETLCKLICCCCCIILIGVIAVGSQYISGLVSIMEVLQGNV